MGRKITEFFIIMGIDAKWVDKLIHTFSAHFIEISQKKKTTFTELLAKIIKTGKTPKIGVFPGDSDKYLIF